MLMQKRLIQVFAVIVIIIGIIFAGVITGNRMIEYVSNPRGPVTVEHVFSSLEDSSKIYVLDRSNIRDSGNFNDQDYQVIEKAKENPQVKGLVDQGIPVSYVGYFQHIEADNVSMPTAVVGIESDGQLWQAVIGLGEQYQVISVDGRWNLRDSLSLCR
jgi:hypothetical protein